MRFFGTLILLVIVGGAGWIAGSLHPAPDALLALFKQSQAVETETPETVTEVVDTDAAVMDVADIETEPDTTDAPPSVSEPVAPTPSPAPEIDTSTQYRIWISEARAAHPYPESEDRMHAVMMCESGGNAEAVNPAGPYIGLFQYVEGTWNGDWNSYREAGRRDARAQIFATALAWSLGMQSHWGCYSRTQ